MTIKSMQELKAQADATIEDNITGAISAADVRTLIKDFVDSVTPGYGALSFTTGSFNVPITTPSVFTPWSAVTEQDPGYFTASAANGQITRLITTAGLAAATDLHTLNGNVSGTGGHLVTIEIFKNGAATGWKTSVACESAANPVGFNISGITYTPTVDAVYDMRVVGSVAGAKTFSNLSWIVQSQPVASY